MIEYTICLVLVVSLKQFIWDARKFEEDGEREAAYACAYNQDPR